MGWLKLPTEVDQMGLRRYVVKPDAYLPAYEEQLEHLRDQEFTLLELGVFGGQSLEMWRDAFPLATIVGVDIEDCAIDLGDRVHFVRGDQRDGDLLAGLRRRFAPERGFGLIIDDASHVAEPTAASLGYLFNEHLADGGLYIVEDWKTGYMAGPDWPDWGGREMDPAKLDARRLGDHRRGLGKGLRYPSHDYGMVGLVKRLLDQMAFFTWRRSLDGGTAGAGDTDAAVGAGGSARVQSNGRADELLETDLLEITKLTFYPGMTVLHKAPAGSAPQ